LSQQTMQNCSSIVFAKKPKRRAGPPPAARRGLNGYNQLSAKYSNGSEHLMPTTVDKVYNDALTLSDEERSELAARLLEQLDPDTWTPENWEEEVRQRVEEIRSGQATMIPWEQARAVLWNEVNGQ